MLNFVNSFLGFNVLDVFGIYFGYMVIVLFAVLSLDFLIQIIMVFWRWLLHDK